MKKLLEFVSQHMADDTTRLILDKGKWPDIDMDTAVNCIESRRKLKGKVNEWYENPEMVFPLKLSAEQCSSSATGHYKAALAEKIGISVKAIEKHLANLKKDGLIEHIGPAKGGHWKVK